MKNQELKKLLIKFNELQINKNDSLEIINPSNYSAIKGGTADIDCKDRFKIKCQQSFTIEETN
ncbi:hypothetical protein SAMN05421827_12546 [Pedobacter terrae]|uniref:Uncharacterized protein n=1 Tax=Pedobacter terrae TaxID=405671 RepID=A0A1G8CM03_9SPHI|nr:hypothetical protein [Pedobacter terrae]SDH46436.1 hypothetical protein SAMN05421827_12546 [Pedobacter terrae]